MTATASGGSGPGRPVCGAGIRWVERSYHKNWVKCLLGRGTASTSALGYGRVGIQRAALGLLGAWRARESVGWGGVGSEPEPDLRGARWSLWGLSVYSEDSGLQDCKWNTDTVAL